VVVAGRTEAAGAAVASALAQSLDRARERVAHARSRLRLLSPSAQVERGFLRLDDLTSRLGSALRASLQHRRHTLAAGAARLERSSPETRVRIESHRLLSLGQRLRGASPRSVLARGFAIMRDETGKPITRRAGIAGGRSLEAEFADGRLPLRSE
jgi:exodeoxyribonuclease VII large subunit